MGNPFPGPWTFEHHPWLLKMIDSENDFCVGQKAAQMGFTEVALNRTFFKMDIRGVSTLYILPAKNPDASDFSASRFDPALELSPYLRNIFSDVKNVGHKRAGSTSLYIRGSRSRSGLKSVPAGFLVFDEVDEMTQDNIPLAFERQSGQMEKQTWMISTPTIDETGINKFFQRSSQQEFFFQCPSCKRRIRFKFPESIEITSDDPADPKLKNTFYKCHDCNSKLDNSKSYLSTGEWVKAKEAEYDGYHINQMYSPTIAPWEFAESYLLAQTNAAYEQEFFNSKLGLPHIVKGARVSESDINACIGEYKNSTEAQPNSIITMGIDVGNWLHYIVAEYTLPNTKTPDINMGARCKILEINKILKFEDLDKIVFKYRPSAVVIDANPERRKAYEFAQRFWGHIWLCFYGHSVAGKQINKTRDSDGQELEQQVTVDRTSWLDLTLNRFPNKTIKIPLDTPNEFKSNIKALVRKPEIDRHGNPIARYVNVADDHFGHSLNYAEIALALARINVNRNIRSPL